MVRWELRHRSPARRFPSSEIALTHWLGQVGTGNSAFTMYTDIAMSVNGDKVSGVYYGPDGNTITILGHDTDGDGQYDMVYRYDAYQNEWMEAETTWADGTPQWRPSDGPDPDDEDFPEPPGQDDE